MKSIAIVALILLLWSAIKAVAIAIKGVRTAKSVFKNQQKINWFKHYPETYCIAKESQAIGGIALERCTKQCTACAKSMQLYYANPAKAELKQPSSQA